jgi:hypothetical protein
MQIEMDMSRKRKDGIMAGEDEQALNSSAVGQHGFPVKRISEPFLSTYNGAVPAAREITTVPANPLFAMLRSWTRSAPFSSEHFCS